MCTIKREEFALWPAPKILSLPLLLGICFWGGELGGAVEGVGAVGVDTAIRHTALPIRRSGRKD